MSTIQLPNLETLTDTPDSNDLLLIRKSGSITDQKIKYYRLVSNILSQLDYHEGVINTYDVLPMRLVNPQGGYLESKDRIKIRKIII